MPWQYWKKVRNVGKSVMLAMKKGENVVICHLSPVYREFISVPNVVLECSKPRASLTLKRTSVFTSTQTLTPVRFHSQHLQSKWASTAHTPQRKDSS